MYRFVTIAADISRRKRSACGRHTNVRNKRIMFCRENAKEELGASCIGVADPVAAAVAGAAIAVRGGRDAARTAATDKEDIRPCRFSADLDR